MKNTRISTIDLLPTGVLLCLLFIAGCNNGPHADAYGNFDADEVTVSAQAQGQLRIFNAREGTRLEADAMVGQVDTTQLVAQRAGLYAQRRNLLAQQRSLYAQEKAALAQQKEADAYADALDVQLETAEEELDRTRRLFAGNAATARELNEREGNVEQLRAQVRQTRARVETAIAQAQVPRAQAGAINDQVASLDAQVRQVDDRLANAAIRNPVAGIVLTTIARVGEVVQTGSPLYTIAPLDTLTLRAYATGNQLPQVRLGMSVEVLFDDGTGGLSSRRGVVTYISPKAEFTPTPIQTRDQRAELVYAFEIAVPNSDGMLKIGMPGEVSFSGLAQSSL